MKSKICQYRINRRKYIRNCLLKADPNRKRFWAFIKARMSSPGHITGCKNKDGKMVFKQEEVEEVVIDHFSNIFKGERKPTVNEGTANSSVDSRSKETITGSVSRDPTEFEEEICPPMSIIELDDLIKKLPTGKSSGYDSIPNEFLINSNFKFRQYLNVFYNKIIKEGRVPEDLNLGKCLLLHKVEYYLLNQIIICRSKLYNLCNKST